MGDSFSVSFGAFRVFHGTSQDNDGSHRTHREDTESENEAPFVRHGNDIRKGRIFKWIYTFLTGPARRDLSAGFEPGPAGLVPGFAWAAF